MGDWPSFSTFHHSIIPFWVFYSFLSLIRHPVSFSSRAVILFSCRSIVWEEAAYSIRMISSCLAWASIPSRINSTFLFVWWTSALTWVMREFICLKFASTCEKRSFISCFFAILFITCSASWCSRACVFSGVIYQIWAAPFLVWLHLLLFCCKYRDFDWESTENKRETSKVKL